MTFLKLQLVMLVVMMAPELSLGGGCTWPSDFDLSKVTTNFKFGEQDRSWDTRIQIETSIITEVNAFIKVRTRILIVSNDTFRMIKEEGNQWSYLSEYQCEKKIDENTFVIKSVPIKEIEQNAANVHQTSYRCMGLTVRSKHVIQWKLGEMYDDPIQDCPEGFTDREVAFEWPLVYFPVEDTDENGDIVRHLDYLDEYPECPEIEPKGYLMEVTAPDGSAVCSNTHPFPRFEVGCSPGGGLRMLPSTTNDCREYSFLGGAGAKMHCLGNWVDSAYKFIMLVPAGKKQIKSFHCLRINKDDITKEDAILFLDTACKLGEPAESDNYLKIKLRKKEIEGLCEDYDDQCSEDDCDGINYKHACIGTCSSQCVFDEKLVQPSEELSGEWIVQTRRSRDNFTINSDGFHLDKLGKFKAYGTPNDTHCMKAPPVLEDAASYVIADTGTDLAKGCLPRVTQLTMKTINHNVALMQVMEPSPLRANKFSSNANLMCNNNLQEAQAFSNLYRPYWPFISESPKGTGSGWFTLIKKHENQQLSSCNLNNPDYDYTLASEVKLEFLSPSKKRYSCDGQAHNVGDNKYMIDYHKCHGNSSYGASIDFECLGSYKFNDKYQAVIGKIPTVVSFNDEVLLNEEYYCILFPSKADRSLPVLVHTAGDCDVPNIEYVQKHYRKSVLRMTYVPEVLGGAVNGSASFMTLLVGFLVTLLLFSSENL